MSEVTLDAEADTGLDAVVLAYRMDGELHTLAERAPPATGSIDGAIPDE